MKIYINCLPFAGIELYSEGAILQDARRLVKRGGLCGSATRQGIANWKLITRMRPGAVLRRPPRHTHLMFYPALLALVGTSPWPPTGSVTALLPKLAISGLPRTMARCTEGSASEARWLCSLSQTSVIQIAFASAGSFATT